MQNDNPITEDLIAPCGMNCAICSRYLAQKNNLKKSGCPGCRSRNKECTYLFAKCSGISHGKTAGLEFCSKCELYPSCKDLNRMDARYRKNYGMSVIENLENIQKHGIKKFAEEQYEKYACTKCGELISVHNKKCFKCDTITRLIEKG